MHWENLNGSEMGGLDYQPISSSGKAQYMCSAQNYCKRNKKLKMQFLQQSFYTTKHADQANTTKQLSP